MRAFDLRATSKPRVYAWCGCLLAFSLALSQYSRQQAWTRSVGHITLGPLLAPFESRMADVRQRFDTLRDSFNSIQSLRGENRVLKEQLAAQAARGSDMAEMRRELVELRRLLNFRQATSVEVIGARVLRRNFGPYTQSLAIDRGAAAGLSIGSAVFSHAGVVGQIVALGADSAEVMLLSDSLSGVDVFSQDERVHGIVVGAGGLKARLAYVDVDSANALKPGGLLVTTGLDGIFPKGLPVASVQERASENQALFATFSTKPAVDFGMLEEVLVYRKK